MDKAAKLELTAFCLEFQEGGRLHFDFFMPWQIGELYEHDAFDWIGFGLFDQLNGSAAGASSGDQVVDNHNLLAFLQGIILELKFILLNDTRLTLNSLDVVLIDYEEDKEEEGAYLSVFKIVFV